MKAFSILLLACLAAQAQTTPPAPAPTLPDLPDNTVLAVFEDGYSMTMGEFKKIYSMLPPQAQQNAVKQPESFFKGWGVMRRLAHLAEQQKLDEQSPTRETLDYYRMNILSQAEMQDALGHITVPPADATRYYEAHQDKYKEVHLKAIQLAFSEPSAASSSSSSSPKSRTEDEAKALAAKLLAQLRGGADFVKVVAQYSDDASSKAKDGEFTTIHASDNIPQDILSAVMALKPGEISEPIRQPNAIYLFRAESVTYKPFDQVSNEIFNQLKMDQYRQWVEQNDRSVKVEFKSPAFFGTAPADGKPPSGH